MMLKFITKLIKSMFNTKYIYLLSSLLFKTGHIYRQGQTTYRSAAQTGCKVNWPVEAGAARSPLGRSIG